MLVKMKNNCWIFLKIITLSTLINFSGCATKHLLIPISLPDQTIVINENNSAIKTEEVFTISTKARYKNRFILFNISIDNQSDKEMRIKKENITILNGEGIIQNILDEKQIENIYNNSFFIGFVPGSFPPDDPYFWNFNYPPYRHYPEYYYSFSLDRKLFLSKLYKDSFQFGKVLPGTKLQGDIYIQDGELSLPLKLVIELNGKSVEFQFDKEITHRSK